MGGNDGARRWPVVPRACTALTWGVLLAQALGSSAPRWLAAAAVALTGAVCAARARGPALQT